MNQASTSYVVGGAPRDILLGRTPKDLDYVWVGVMPEYMLSLGYSQVGADFPIFLDNQGNEHALARKERKVAAGYNGFEVDFDPSVTLEDDLIRRDLTINSLAVKVENWDKFVQTHDERFVIDLHNGISDLRAKILRHTSEAFAEDPVRVLRIARFAARYGFNIALDTLALMTNLVDSGELDALVSERVWAETEKALAETNPMAFFKTLNYCGAAAKLFPELELNDFFETNLVNTPSDARLRFALTCLKLTDSKITELCDRLTVPNDFKTLATRAVKLVNTLRNELTPESVIAALEATNGFQDIANVAKALHVAKHSAYNTPEFRQRRKILANLAPVVCDNVRFANLSQEQQETLKGPEIRAAIRKLRLQLVSKLL